MLDTISLHYGGKSVLIIAHQVVVLCMRYLLENLNEAEILLIDREGDVAKCVITEYLLEEGISPPAMKLSQYNFVAPSQDAQAPVTSAPDKNVGAR